MTRPKPPAPFVSNGRCVAYLRVSTDVQVHSGLGLMGQGETVDREAGRLGLRWHSHHKDICKNPRPGIYVDDGVSAFTRAFHKRPAGKALLENLQRGDTLLISRMDRAFRSMSDFCHFLQRMTEMGVRLRVCGTSFDTGTAIGMATAMILVVIAEWESRRKSERIKAAKAACEKAGGIAITSKNLKRIQLGSAWRPTGADREAIPKTDGPGRILMYVRCSHRDSAHSGLGLLAQTDLVRGYSAHLIEKNPQLVIHDLYMDEVVSAKGRKLSYRPQGSLMVAEAKAGDHVVFSTLDRAFRQTIDMVNQIADFIKRGVHVHFAEEMICMDDKDGALMAAVMTLFAEQESELISQRTREARKQLARQGRYCGGSVPTFWKIYDTRATRQLVLDKFKIAGFRYVMLLVNKGMSRRDALWKLEQLVAKRQNRPPIILSGVWKSSKMGRTIPKELFGKDGWARPFLQELSFSKCMLHYPKAKADWDAQAKQYRELANMPSRAINKIFSTKKTPRGWPAGWNPPNHFRPTVRWRPVDLAQLR